MSAVGRCANTPAAAALTGTPALTSRQVEIVQLAAVGRTARQSARQLGLSERTVQGHLAQARQRIGAASTGELIARVMMSDVIMFTNRDISEHDHEKAGELTRPGKTAGDRVGRRGRPTMMTPDRLATAREMLSSHTVTEIARKLGVSRGTVYAHMHAILACEVGTKVFGS